MNNLFFSPLVFNKTAIMFIKYNPGVFSDVTVLLSLTMFLHQVSDRMPKTSDAVPLISMNESWRIRSHDYLI